MRKEFKDIHKKMDMTVIYVTDNQETALALGTRMVVMNEGSICQDGTPEELAAHPVNCFVGGVVGRSPMNFFLMKVFSEGGRIGLQGASGRMLVPEAVGAVLENNGYVGKEVITGVRAEDVCLSRASEDGQDGHFSARFQSMTGDGTMLRFQAEDADGICQAEGRTDFRENEKIYLFVDAEKIYLFDKDTEKNIL